MTLEFTRRLGANEGQGEVSRKNSAGWERGWEWMKFPPSLPRCNFSCCLWFAPHYYLARPDKGVPLGYLTHERSGPIKCARSLIPDLNQTLRSLSNAFCLSPCQNTISQSKESVPTMWISGCPSKELHHFSRFYLSTCQKTFCGTDYLYC